MREAKRLADHLAREGIRDARVLAAMAAVPREAFVPASLRAHAYDDTALPIGMGQTVSQPYVVARMAEALMATPLSVVLEVGTGSGYNAAVLARLARRVYSIERHGALLASARAHLALAGVANVVLRQGDGTRGWREHAPFDRISVTAAAETLPMALIDQLAPHGMAVLPLGPQEGVQTLTRVERRHGALMETPIAPVRFVPLVSGPPESGSPVSGMASAKGMA